ncbi:MAG: hypothetical protein ACRDI2_15260 [Chloroflexota bacterium]
MIREANSFRSNCRVCATCLVARCCHAATAWATRACRVAGSVGGWVLARFSAAKAVVNWVRSRSRALTSCTTLGRSAPPAPISAMKLVSSRSTWAS